MKFFSFILILFSNVLLAKPLRIGIVPSGDSFCITWAKTQGYFTKAGLSNIEIIEFNEAQKRDAALIGGSIDLANGDLIGATLMHQGSLGIKVLALLLGDDREQELAALMVKDPQIKTLKDLYGKEVGISQNTIIEYLYDRLLEKAGADAKSIKVRAIPDISMRLMLLKEEKISAALLPAYPFSAYAKEEGARVLLDNRGTIYAHAVLNASEAALKSRSEEIKKFLAGLKDAIIKINQAPQEVAQAMADKMKIAQKSRSFLGVYRFALLGLPSKELVLDVQEWLRKKGKIKKTIPYEDLVVQIDPVRQQF